MRMTTLLLNLFLFIETPAGAADFAAFDQDHAGATPGALTVSAAWTAAHGLVLNDGFCSYSRAAKLGCFDPTANGAGADLSCGDAAVLTGGTAWLYLHAAVVAPFLGPPLRAELPLWAFAEAPSPDGSALYVWGMSTGTAARQELWRWTPGGAPAKVLDGPAAMSGGISAWPGAESAGCYAFASYDPQGAEACAGETTVWRWCEREPGTLGAVKRFPGCSGKILVANGAVWNLGGAAAAVYDLATDGVRSYAYEPALLTLAADADGALLEVRWDDGHLAVTRASGRAGSRPAR